jgi:trk system potassium uptake protein TrkA
VYIVIAGGGRLGGRLADSLLAGGHEVFVIDIDTDVVERLRSTLGSVGAVGDATKLSVLNAAGVARSSVFIAVTGRDEDNLAACQLAKSRFNVPRTAAMVQNPDHVELFELAGIDDVVSSTDLILSRIAGALPAHPLVRLMPVTGRSKEVVGIKVPTGGTVVGMPLNEVNVPYGSLISLVIGANGHTEVPSQETVLEPEDEIIAVSPVETTELLYRTLTELR